MLFEELLKMDAQMQRAKNAAEEAEQERVHATPQWIEANSPPNEETCLVHFEDWLIRKIVAAARHIWPEKVVYIYCGDSCVEIKTRDNFKYRTSGEYVNPEQLLNEWADFAPSPETALEAVSNVRKQLQAKAKEIVRKVLNEKGMTCELHSMVCIPGVCKYYAQGGFLVVTW